MKALSYLILTQIKNKLLSLKEKPVLLILYSIATLFFIVAAIALFFIDSDALIGKDADQRVIYTIVAGVGLIFIYSFSISGLTTGSTLFTMADIGLLFTSPISTKRVLCYGLLSSCGKTMLTSVFILFQVVTLRSSFGYGAPEILTLLLLYVGTTIFGQLFAIAIYMLTNGNPFRKNIVKLFLLVASALIALVIYSTMQRQNVGILEAGMRTVDQTWFGYVPLAGWSVMILKGVVESSILGIGIGIILFIIFIIVFAVVLTIGKADYYEDVLVSTEVRTAMLKASKEGVQPVNAVNKKKAILREKDSNVFRGSGAMTLFHKHWLEVRRINRIPFIDLYTIICAVCIYGGTKGSGEEFDYTIYIVIAFLIYLLYFTTIAGKLKYELAKHYIYLIPESSSKKVLASSLSSMIKPAIDGVIFGIVFIIAEVNEPLTCIFVALTYIASGVLFQAFTIVYQKLLGGQPNRLIKAFLGMSLMMTLLTPGIGVSVVLFFSLPESLLFLASLPYTMLAFGFAVLIYCACGNLIDTSEFTGR